MAVAEVPFLNAEGAQGTLADFVVANRSRTREERVIYYRHPQVWKDGTENKQAGWIVWAGSNPNLQLDMISRGFEPLNWLGRVQTVHQDDAPADSPDSYGPWGPILLNPKGRALIPVSQLLTYRWYDPKRLPRSSNPDSTPLAQRGVTFPQLAGVKITEYACPECSDRQFAQPLFLARHLRIAHSYDRNDLVALGKELGVNFAREAARAGTQVRTYEMPAAPEPEPEPAPAFEVEAVTVKGRGKAA